MHSLLPSTCWTDQQWNTAKAPTAGDDTKWYSIIIGCRQRWRFFTHHISWLLPLAQLLTCVPPLCVIHVLSICLLVFFVCVHIFIVFMISCSLSLLFLWYPPAYLYYFYHTSHPIFIVYTISRSLPFLFLGYLATTSANYFLVQDSLTSIWTSTLWRHCYK